MELVTTSKPNRLLVTGDWHIGTMCSHEEGIKKFLQRAKKQCWIHLGDIVEAIHPGDKRYSVDEHPMSLMEAHNKAVFLVGDAAKTCIGLLSGNHEETISREMGSVSNSIAKNAGVKALTYRCFVSFGDTLALFCHSGKPVHTGRTGPMERIVANSSVSLRDSFRKFSADICGMGHIHRCIVAAPVFENKLTYLRGDKETKAIQASSDPRWCFSVPALYKVYGAGSPVSNYADRLGVDPSELGWVEVLFNSKKPGIDAVLQINEHGEQVAEYRAKTY